MDGTNSYPAVAQKRDSRDCSVVASAADGIGCPAWPASASDGGTSEVIDSMTMLSPQPACPAASGLSAGSMGPPLAAASVPEGIAEAWQRTGFPGLCLKRVLCLSLSCCRHPRGVIGLVVLRPQGLQDKGLGDQAIRRVNASGTKSVDMAQPQLSSDAIWSGCTTHYSTSMLSQVRTSFSDRTEVSPAFRLLTSRLFGQALVSL